MNKPNVFVLRIAADKLVRGDNLPIVHTVWRECADWGNEANCVEYFTTPKGNFSLWRVSSGITEKWGIRKDTEDHIYGI